MTLLLALSIGVLFGVGAYMILRRSLVKLVMGLSLLGHGSNLLIYGASTTREIKGRPALVEVGEKAPAAPFADPLPAALILTAIVIGFGILSYTIVLLKRAYQDVGTDDLDVFTSTDKV